MKKRKPMLSAFRHMQVVADARRGEDGALVKLYAEYAASVKLYREKPSVEQHRECARLGKVYWDAFKAQPGYPKEDADAERT